MIEELLKLNEGKTLEFKENLKSLQNIVKTVIAFANTAGGHIIIGVEDKSKKIVGITNPLAEEERLASTINDSISPTIMPDIEIHSYRNKELIVITIPHGTGPFHLKVAGIEKGTYIRLGSTNRLADQEALQTLKNFSRNLFFDELPCPQSKVSDLDWEVIKELFLRVQKKVSQQNAQNIGLITQQATKIIPSHGGIILFGKNRSTLFPEAIIRCARFLGTDKTKILDQADIETYLPLGIEEAIKFVRRNSRTEAKIKNLARMDIPQYPPAAIRETLMNAVVHSDYTIKGIFISVAIFDDRLEITNPGTLPFGQTVAKILAGTSRIRNRVLAKVFYHLKWIEQWGSGIGRIIKECTDAGLHTPLFEELDNQFRVTLYATKKHAAILAPWETKLVNYLKKNSSIGTKSAAELWQVTQRTSRNRLVKLVEKGIIVRQGTSLQDPYGCYVLSNTAT